MLQTARKILVAIIGITVVLIGLAMLVLPGPAFIVIPVGLLILATEFVWARRLLRSIRDRLPAKVQARIPEPRVDDPGADRQVNRPSTRV